VQCTSQTVRSRGPRAATSPAKRAGERLDYESELAEFLGKTARDVKAEEAGDYIFGYTIVTTSPPGRADRPQALVLRQVWMVPPHGPLVRPRDEIPFLRNWTSAPRSTRVRTESKHRCSSLQPDVQGGPHRMTLLPATIIATATPAGVGMAFDPPKFLKTGDVVECTHPGSANPQHRPQRRTTEEGAFP
jgi:2-keto-4-pentenoate hydratase/2-oxohepta-3-ene-1,7-dioic acid hydratase in catechol pathway